MAFLYGNYEDDSAPEIFRTVLADFHLRNPLKRPTWWDDKASRVASRHRSDRSFLQSYFPTATWGSPIRLNRLINNCFRDVTTNVYGVALSDVALRLRIDSGFLPPESMCDIDGIVNDLRSIEMRYWSGMRTWNRVLSIMNAISSNRPVPPGVVLRHGMPSFPVTEGFTMSILNTCIVIGSRAESTAEIFDGDWVRMASDINTQRFLVLVANKIGRRINKDHYPEEEILRSLFDWGDDVLETIGNDGFKILKAYEALVIGKLQCHGEGSLIDNSAFLRNTMEDLVNEDPRFRFYVEKLVGIMDTMSNFHHISQIYGMHRVWGHPLVDSRKGLDKLRLIGKKMIVKDNTLSIDAGRMFKLLFCREYRKKHGCFPKILDGMSLLETKILENDHSATVKGMHLLEEWDRVRFLQAFELPESFNLSMIIADKAISPTKSELVRSIRSKHTVMDSDKRRGVKRWLEDTTLNPKLFLRGIEDGGFSDDHKIIGLTPKERELNPTPRMFSLMAHELRVYVVVTEQMLSDHILKMFPQITMTDSLLDLTKKMYGTVKGQSSLVKRKKQGFWASRVICMSLDFEKWNGHMRREMTHGVFSAIGRLFGLPELYNRTYDIFEECYYYLADGSYLPNVEGEVLVVEEPWSFTGHKGGMEGLRQKGWTIYTVVCLEVILSKYDCTYKIMGMGDNQVLQITVYTKHLTPDGQPNDEGIREMRKIVDDIFKDLVSSFTDAGLPLKPLETWMSEDLYLYGKVPLWKGVPLAMDLKKLMRTFPMSNEDVMTLENALGTISSNSTAATQASACIWTAYVIAITMSSICIQDFMRYHPLLGEGCIDLASKSDRWTLAMSREEKYTYQTGHLRLSPEHVRLLIQMVPKSLGGYNGISVYEMMMRGFPDNLSRDCCYIMNVVKSPFTPRWMKESLTCWITPLYMPDANYSMLLEDVTAVNLLSPRSPTSGIRQLVAKYMSGGVKITNPEFQDLMKSKDRDVSQYLSECLCEGPVLHIRLLHDIYEATIFGYVDGILSKVVKTSTIQKLAINDSKGAVFKTIERDEVNFYKYFGWRCESRGKPHEVMCPTSLCKKMRREGWGKELRGVTTPFPASYMTLAECGKSRVCTCEDGYISIHFPDGQLPNERWNMDIGGNPPYLGSQTKEKVIVGAGGRIYSGEPLVRRPINLLKTINWFVPEESRTAEVIRRCVTAVTDLNPEPYQGIAEGTAGSEVHRYRDSSTSHGALTSSNFLFSTRYHISTDNFFRYSKGSENTDIHYQALFCYVLELTNMMISNKLMSGDIVPRYNHFKQSCYECISPIPEDFIDLVSLKAFDVVPSRVHNPYLFVTSDKIRIMEKLSPLSETAERSLTTTEYVALSGRKRLTWLQDVICCRIVTDIMGDHGSDTHVDVGLLDVKSYERTMYLKLNPTYMIKRTVTLLWRVARWKSREVKRSIRRVEDRDIERTYINMLTSASDHATLGMAMFYCWEETARKINVFPEMISPNTNPISVSSACACMKANLIAIMLKRRWRISSRCIVVAEDEKYSNLVYKTILSEWVECNMKCEDCNAECDLIDSSNIKWGIDHCKCRRGHILKDRLIQAPWVKSSVTVERLRKDGEADSPEIISKGITVSSVRGGFLVHLLDSSRFNLRTSVIGYQEPVREQNFESSGRVIKHALLAMKSLPTASWYKCLDIYTMVADLIKDRTVMCVGDGLGTSGAVLSSLGAKSVISSTILDPDEAIPQTYVHNVSPMVSDFGLNNVDTSLMINRCNNILDENWLGDWKSTLSGCDIIVSDVEIIDRGAADQRQQIFQKILQAGTWDLAVIKDYLYSKEDLVNRIGCAGHACYSWALVTTKFRSSTYPEVWWVIIRVKPDRVKVPTNLVSVDARNCTGLWRSIRLLLEDRYDEEIVDKEAAIAVSLMSPPDGEVKMMTYLQTWGTFPVVGSILPQKSSYTALFLYMKKSKRPSYVKMQRASGQLKMYDSDYYKLRDRLFALAVSMIASIDGRMRLLNESDHWHLEWYEKSAHSWWCQLKRSETDVDLPCKVMDYIPILNILMRKEKLLFRKWEQTIEFAPVSSRRTGVYFPISKNAAST